MKIFLKKLAFIILVGSIPKEQVSIFVTTRSFISDQLNNRWLPCGGYLLSSLIGVINFVSKQWIMFFIFIILILVLSSTLITKRRNMINITSSIIISLFSVFFLIEMNIVTLNFVIADFCTATLLFIILTRRLISKAKLPTPEKARKIKFLEEMVTPVSLLLISIDNIKRFITGGWIIPDNEIIESVGLILGCTLFYLGGLTFVIFTLLEEISKDSITINEYVNLSKGKHAK
jgi:hypothetical protein